MKRHEISEQQWNRIKDKFPPEKKPQGGRPGKSNREMLNAILYWLNTGIPWRDLPDRFGPWQSVYSRFRAWTKAGVWEDRYPHSLDGAGFGGRNNADDGQHHDQSPPACQRGKKGGYHEETGRSRGGLTTKAHAVTFVCWLEERGGIVVIPSRSIAKHPRKTDWHTYKECHLVENLFLKLKNNRRFATRYEKKALYFRAVVCLACILVWLL